MCKRKRWWGGRNGSSLPVVLGLGVLGSMVAATIVYGTGSRMRQAGAQIKLEQAFYLAEAGAERAASHIAAGNLASATLTGALGDGSYVAVIDVQPQAGGEAAVNIAATGTVHGVSRGIAIRGLRRVSWARFALWYDQEVVTPLWMVGGEKFRGPVYSRPMLQFHSSGVTTLGQVHFYDKVWSAASSIKKETSAVNPIFDLPLRLNAPVETTSTIDFADLRAQAAMEFDGATTITINGTTMLVTNLRKGWSNKSVAVPVDGLIYVRTVTSGDSGTRKGDITLSAPNGLNGRLTLVAENSIKITGHVRYARNPQTDHTSTDALGLIAMEHVTVEAAAPSDLDVYAHIICRNGGFGVTNYDKGSSRGMLNVYGGIVNKIRQAVGTTSPTGYRKNYVFDPRFAKDPPPSYPKVVDEFEWREWEG